MTPFFYRGIIKTTSQQEREVDTRVWIRITTDDAYRKKHIQNLCPALTADG